MFYSIYTSFTTLLIVYLYYNKKETVSYVASVKKYLNAKLTMMNQLTVLENLWI